MKSVLSLLGCALVAVIMFSCEGPKEPEYKTMEKVELLSLTKELAVVRAVIVMENPNPVGVDIDSMSVDTWVNGVKVATTTQTEVSTISPGTFKLPLQVDVPIKEVFNKGNIGGALSALVNKKADLKYDGFLYLNIAGVSTKVKVDYEDVLLLKKSEVVDSTSTP